MLLDAIETRPTNGRPEIETIIGKGVLLLEQAQEERDKLQTDLTAVSEGVGGNREAIDSNREAIEASREENRKEFKGINESLGAILRHTGIV